MNIAEPELETKSRFQVHHLWPDAEGSLDEVLHLNREARKGAQLELWSLVEH
jgi:hypothetical protein